MKNSKTGILFDLDGTLWDSSQTVIDSWNAVIETLPDFHRKGTVDDMMQLMGKTMDEIAVLYFNTVPRERALELMDLCSSHENEHIRKYGGVLMPDLYETLEILSKEYFLAVVSNCQIGYIEAFMEYHKTDRFFDDHEDFGTTGLAKSENIRLVMERNGLEKAFYVGDVFGDYDAATKAGIPFIHAAYGYGEIPEAKYRIDGLKELPDLMHRLTGGKG